MSTLLLLEDDLSLIDGLQYSLEKNGYELQVVKTVREAKTYVDSNKKMDLMILDVSLSDGTGFEVCEYVRKKSNDVPIIFLTAADEEFNVIRGLDCGGDDYMTKPFKLGELCSRIKALLRRSGLKSENAEQSNCADTLQIKGKEITVDLLGSRVYFKGEPLELTAIEYKLLCILLRNKNRIVTRQMIFDSMWDGKGDFVDDNTLSVYIRRLREKMERDPSHPEFLKTARGLGYMWEENAHESD